MSGNNQKLNIVVNTESSSEGKLDLVPKENLCRSLIAILMDSSAKKEQISHLINCIKGFIFKKNEDRQGCVTGILLNQKNVFILFLETAFDAQIEFLRDQLLQFKSHPESAVASMKLVVFNELFANR